MGGVWKAPSAEPQPTTFNHPPWNWPDLLDLQNRSSNAHPAIITEWAFCRVRERRRERWSLPYEASTRRRRADTISNSVTQGQVATAVPSRQPTSLVRTGRCGPMRRVNRGADPLHLEGRRGWQGHPVSHLADGWDPVEPFHQEFGLPPAGDTGVFEQPFPWVIGHLRRDAYDMGSALAQQVDHSVDTVESVGDGDLVCKCEFSRFAAWNGYPLSARWA